ncbi:3111_t:CDS:10, partial [Entrophospora sp. SA101]
VRESDGGEDERECEKDRGGEREESSLISLPSPQSPSSPQLPPSSQTSENYENDEYSLQTGPLGNELGNESPDNHIQEQPRLLIMGLRRSGKSSIQKVVFHKMPANQTLFLESNNNVIKETITSFIDFQVWDFPGQTDYFDSTFDTDVIFGEYGALIFVIDAQDDYVEALNRLHQTITRAYSVNPYLIFEVFIHKVDALSDEYKIDTQRDIQQRTTDDLADVGLENVSINFYLTSIYDHSIFEAFSKVIQKLIPQLPTLENLLNILCSNSGIEKAFLFDIKSKIYIATDSSPVDMQSYELCSDMIDVIIDISELYEQTDPSNKRKNNNIEEELYESSDNKSSINVIDTNDDGGGVSLDTTSATYDTTAETTGGDTSSLIKLNNGTVLSIKGINRFLALVCLLRSDGFENPGLINYNFQCFKQAMTELFGLKNNHR